MQATFKTENGRMLLIGSDRKILMSRSIPSPKQRADKTMDLSGLARIRGEFLRYVMKNKIEVVGGCDGGAQPGG